MRYVLSQYSYSSPYPVTHRQTNKLSFKGYVLNNRSNISFNLLIRVFTIKQICFPKISHPLNVMNEANSCNL